jgi:hypothetical protein
MKNDDVIPMDDPRWEEAFRALNAEDRLAYLEKVYDVVMSDPVWRDSAGPEALAELKERIDTLERDINEGDQAQCEYLTSLIKMNAAADKLLANFDDNSKPRPIFPFPKQSRRKDN